RRHHRRTGLRGFAAHPSGRPRVRTRMTRRRQESLGLRIPPAMAPKSDLDHAGAVETELFIGGKWVPASSGNRFDVLDPATGDVIASVADGGVDDAAAAVDAAGGGGP